jgi:hypothetical protein
VSCAGIVATQQDGQRSAGRREGGGYVVLRLGDALTRRAVIAGHCSAPDVRATAERLSGATAQCACVEDAKCCDSAGSGCRSERGEVSKAQARRWWTLNRRRDPRCPSVAASLRNVGW